MDALELRDNAKEQLQKIKDIETGVEYLNKVKAIETWAKAEKKDAELQNMVAEQKLRTQRILGNLIKEGQRRGEIASQKSNRRYDIVKEVNYIEKPKTLPEIGITRFESMNFQKIAKLPEEIFEEEIAKAKDESNNRIELTTARLLKVAKKLEFDKNVESQRTKIKETKNPDGTYDVIIIDPPWNYGREYDPDGSRVANPYPEMTQDELKKMEIPANDNAILWLWTTHAFIRDALELLGEWGFEFKAILTWDKEKIGMGHWLRMQTEFCLLAIKGKPLWNNTTYRDIIREPRREHSRKPEAFYKMINDICFGSKVELFSRKKRDGIDVFGNDINRF